VGRSIAANLKDAPFPGDVYPVNPRRDTLLGLRCYRDIASVPEPVDLAVIATPASTVPGVIRECVDAGVPAGIIISAGFREIGERGAALEAEILDVARSGGMRIVGPNCLGLMSPHHMLNATFANTLAHPGHLGFISQSGALSDHRRVSGLRLGHGAVAAAGCNCAGGKHRAHDRGNSAGEHSHAAGVPRARVSDGPACGRRRPRGLQNRALG
jgi:predicted CoA-binding protein